MPKVLITGISGFTGSHLCDYLAGLGNDVYGIHLSPIKDPCLKIKARQLYQGDIRDKDFVERIIKELKPDYIFHLAGLVGGDDLDRLLNVNLFGTRNLLEAIKKIKTRILIPGSAAEYGIIHKRDLPVKEDSPLNPINLYGLSKVAQINLGFYYFIKYNLPVYLVRPFNISGPKEPQNLVCGSIAKRVIEIKKKNLKPIIALGNLNTRRDFVDVRDLVRGYWEVINKGTPGRVYNLCSGIAYSIREVVEIFSNLTMIDFKVKSSKRYIRKIDIPIMVGDNTRIKEEIGWYPKFKFEKTLEDLLHFYDRIYE